MANSEHKKIPTEIALKILPMIAAVLKQFIECDEVLIYLTPVDHDADLDE